METYQALDIVKLFNVDEMKDNDISCWLLYQTNEETGSSIYLFSTLTRIKIKYVRPETLCYILYKEGEYYKKEILAEQIVENRLSMEQMLLKEGFDITLSEEQLEKWARVPIAWDIPNKKEIYEIIVDEFNGFCVFYPIERNRFPADGISMVAYHKGETRVGLGYKTYASRILEVCYHPNTKKLYKTFLDRIFCKIDLEKVDFDYIQYFAKTLDDEQMNLGEKESWELYDFLEENVKSIENYYLSGKAKWFNDVNGELYIKDVCVLKKGKSLQTVLYDNREATIKEPYIEQVYNTIRHGEASEDKTIDEKTVQVLYEWWIEGRMIQTVAKARMIGVLELWKING